MTHPDIKALIDRVEACKGRLDDETLGRVICAVLGERYGDIVVCCGDDGSDEFAVYDDGAVHYANPVYSDYRSRCPDVSLDAALGLVERVLPGWFWEVGSRAGRGHASLEPPHSTFLQGGSVEVYDRPIPALAVTLALLKAIQSQGEEK